MRYGGDGSKQRGPSDDVVDFLGPQDKMETDSTFMTQEKGGGGCEPKSSERNDAIQELEAWNRVRVYRDILKFF